MRRSSSSLRVALLGHFLYNSGSSQALLGYFRAARHFGCDLRLSSLSLADSTVRAAVPPAPPRWEADLTIIIFESYQFLSPEALRELERCAPRSRRLIIDADGKFLPPTQVGTDTNHSTPNSYTLWTDLYNRLSDVILQPCVGRPTPPARAFLYFGIDLNRPTPMELQTIYRPYGLIYVGNNWYRWQDVVWLIRSLQPIRQRLGRIALFGRWWDGTPFSECPQQTYSDPLFLHEHEVEYHPSVPYGTVEEAMSLGRLSPIFIRPILNHFRFATPRMFETFASATVPLLPPYMTHYRAIYGSAAERLWLPENPLDAVNEILENYPDYLSLARTITSELALKHSYECRITELLEMIA